MDYILLPTREIRDALLQHLNRTNIAAVFPYIPPHSAPMGQEFGYQEGDLPVTEEMSGRLLRLPLGFEIRREEQDRVIESVASFLAASLSKPRRVLAIAAQRVLVMATT